jgi:hypothetical protein
VSWEPPLLAAAVLAAGGADFVIVGSAGLRLHGLETPVHDLDVVPAPTDTAVQMLRRAIEALVPFDRWPTEPPVRSLPAIIRTRTSYGLVDVLVERGRVAYQRLLGRSTKIKLLGVELTVASVADIEVLRRRFKESAHG